MWSDITPGDNSIVTSTPCDSTPGDNSPGDNAPGDNSLGDSTPGDSTPGDNSPGAASYVDARAYMPIVSAHVGMCSITHPYHHMTFERGYIACATDSDTHILITSSFG